jgi:hypothetical protein
MSNDNQDAKARREAFVKHLEEASRIVSTWPAWKQSLLDGPLTGPPSQSVRSSDPRKPR